VLAVFGTLRGLFPPSGGLRGNAGSGWVGYEGQPVANSGSGLLILVRQIARIHKIRTSENGVWDIQDLAFVLRRAHLPRTPVNRPETLAQAAGRFACSTAHSRA
jgi:hypothetical protein